MKLFPETPRDYIRIFGPAGRECFMHLGLDGVAWTPNRFLVGFHLAEALGNLASSIGPGFIASGANRANDPSGAA